MDIDTLMHAGFPVPHSSARLTERELQALDNWVYAQAAQPPAAALAPPTTRVVVYIAGPLTHGDPLNNAAKANVVAGQLMQQADEQGVDLACIIPHAYRLIDDTYPRPYERWMASCLLLVERADVLLRLPGYSPGADREVAHAKARGIPVVYYSEEPGFDLRKLTQPKRLTQK